MKLSSLQKGLIAHYTLDNITKAQDLTPYNNNGTANGGITIGGSADRFGIANRATTFDGTDDYVDAGNGTTLNLTNSLSISAWINPDTSGVQRDIIRYGYSAGSKLGLLLYLNSNGSIIFNLGNSVVLPSCTANSIATLGTWDYYVGTYDGTTMKLYRNGILQTDTKTLVPPIVYSGATFKISSTSAYFDGLIDDVRVHNRALSVTEIIQLYQSYRPKLTITGV